MPQETTAGTNGVASSNVIALAVQLSRTCRRVKRVTG